MRERQIMPGPYYPLQGLRVLEFCWVWAGPFLGQFLADLGAEVIKVEWYDRFDVYRTRGVERIRGKVPEKLRREMSPSFHSLNRNKIGFAVNLKDKLGVDLIKRLAGKSDMLIENWSSGTLARLGLGYEALRSANPKLVMLSLSAFGPNSRLKDMRSYGLVTSSLGGAEAMIKVDDEFVGSPTFVISDPNAALFGLLAAMAATIHSRKQQQGVNMVVSQLEAVMTLISGVPTATKTSASMRHGVFETKDGQYVGVSTPADVPAKDMVAWCRGMNAKEAVERIVVLGGHASIVTNIIDTPHSPVFADLEVRMGAEHPITGRGEVIAAPWRINGKRAPLRKTAPLMAEGNSYVLRNILGLTEDEIGQLQEKNIV